jgi:hypothetical protein
MCRISTQLLCFLMALCMLPGYTHVARAQGQTTGAVQGRVYDIGTGLPIAGAAVTVKNQDTGLERTTISDADGIFFISTLPPGFYTISANFEGYDTDQEYIAQNFVIRLSKTNTVQPPPIGLRKAGGAPQPPAPAQNQQAAGNESLEQLVNTVDATRRGNFDQRQLQSLPLAGIRTFDSLAFLVPGVSDPPQPIGRSTGPGIGAGIGTSGQFSVNGLRSRANNFTVDGSDNNDQDVAVRRQGFLSTTPQAIESIQEFQISTLLWDSEFGRNPASQVNAVSRSGGNEYHGQAYSFLNNSNLNARNAFDFTGGQSGEEDSLTRTQAGVYFSGPIIRNRTQFFSSFEYQKINAFTENHFSTPGPDERLLKEKFGILTRDTSFNNRPNYTTTDATPLGKNILSFYPLPNNSGGPFGPNTFTQILPADGEDRTFSFRLTEQVTSSNTLNGRYNFSDDDRIIPSINQAIRSTIGSETRTQNLSLTLDSAFSPTLFNQARFSFGRTRLDFAEQPGSPFLFQGTLNSQITLLRNDAPPLDVIRTSRTGPLGEVIIQPFSPVGVDAFLFPQQRANNTFQYADTVSKRVSSHSFKFGGDIRRVQLNSLQDRNYRTLVVFNNSVSAGFGPSFLLEGATLASIGAPASILQTLTAGTPDSIIGLRFTEYDLFFNDNWRVRKNFSIDYGVRYQYNSVPREVNNRIERSLKLESLPAPESAFDDPLLTRAFNRGVDAYRTILDGRSKIYDNDPNNFGPHIGFAWDPRSNGKTSIRGGYGIFYDTILGSLVSQSRNVFPNEIPVTIDISFLGPDGITLLSPSILALGNRDGSDFLPLVRARSNQLGGTQKDFVALVGALFLQNSRQSAGGLAFTLPSKDLPTPYVHQGHLTIEQEIFNDYLVSVSYVGTRGTKLTRLTTPNLGPNSTPVIDRSLKREGAFLFVSQIPFNRPEGALGAYQIFENSANSNYNALQLELRKRYSQGFTLTAAYTLSRAIDDVSDIVQTAGASAIAQDSFNLKAERGNAGFDARHRFTASAIWDLPFYRGATGNAALLLGGWQITTIFQTRTGQPFTLDLPIDANFDGNLTDRPSTTQGLIFFDQHGSQRVAIGQGKDITDFISLGQSSSVGRNTVRGDSIIVWDLAINKAFSINERNKLEIRTEFFNILNRANFGLPVRTIGAPGFGSSTDVISPARTVQFALKFTF